MSTPPSGRARVPGPPPPAETPAESDEPTPVRSTGRARVGAPGGSGRGPLTTARPGARYEPPRKKKIKPRWGRIALVLVVLIALLTGGGVLTAYLYVNHFNSKLNRVDAFSSITGGRPPILVKGAQNILLLGSDSRDPSDSANNGGWRTDTIILMHITASHDHAYMISIPRDTWTYIPKSPSHPSLGDTHAKINAAFSWGGLPLTVETIERFTGVHIDHTVLINFAGFDKVTDALGGVDMYVDQTITSIHKPHRVFTKGTHHFDGAEALDYVRQREQFAGGDFTREKHQQEFLKDIVDKAATSGTVTNPSKLSAFLNAMTSAVVVDKSFDLASMALQFRHLNSSDMTFMSSPSAGTGTEGGQSVVEPDAAKDTALYKAVGTDKIAEWLAANPSS